MKNKQLSIKRMNRRIIFKLNIYTLNPRAELLIFDNFMLSHATGI